MPYRLLLFVTLLAVIAPTAGAQWIEWVDVTATALDVAPLLVADDEQEKDYAWGDVDHDGDVDLVIVRKEPFTTIGKEPNLLLLNQNGVLTDRTADFASASDVVGDNGFLTPTNDRDVALVDVDQDGWLDIVTTATLSDPDPKHIGHPRVYRNRGCSGACLGTDDWLGFIYEDARIPQLLTYDGQLDGNPRFCAVAAGDVNGDGYPDLYFSDYDLSVVDPIPGPDYNDKLLLNQGALNPGFFTDVTAQRFSGIVTEVAEPFVVSNFGAANAVVDLDGDDLAEIVKHSALGPYYVGVAYSDAGNPGFFDTYDVLIQGSPYFVSAGDLNHDDVPELIVTDDGDDRYFVDTGSGYLSYGFSFSHFGIGTPANDDGFGGNNLAVDLNNDGWDEVLVTDVDVDVGGCGRRMHIYRNLGGTPGEVPVLQEQTTGIDCQNFKMNPPTCIVAGIPADRLIGVHDVAVFDITGDGWNDMIVGRCSGTQVYAQLPPGPPAGSVGQLMIERSFLDAIKLSWGVSCEPADGDYAIYEGQLATLGERDFVVCSTQGATSKSLLPDVGDTYYLVVPHNGLVEGSYGRDSHGLPRLRAPGACYAQHQGACIP